MIGTKIKYRKAELLLFNYKLSEAGFFLHVIFAGKDTSLEQGGKDLLGRRLIIQKGWINNFRLANIHGKLNELHGWVRNGLRYCIWHHWKKRERKRKNLIRLGFNPRDVFRWSRSRLGGWAIAQSPILNTTITVELLCKRGYEFMLSWYQKVAPHKFTPTLFPIV